MKTSTQAKTDKVVMIKAAATASARRCEFGGEPPVVSSK